MPNKFTYKELEKSNSEPEKKEESLKNSILAITIPLNGLENIKFKDLFNIDDIQQLQDEFANATGVASIITTIDGTPITKPSNFCRLCSDIIRKTDKGRVNCYKSDSVIGSLSPGGPTIQPCMSGGLWDAGAAISVEGRHIANWLIGQVRDETQTEEKIREYAKEIGANEAAVVEAFREVPGMSRKKFGQIAQMLYTLANQLSASAYQTLLQARFLEDSKKAEDALKEGEAQLHTFIRTIPDLVWLKDKDGVFLLCNHKFERLIGANEKDIVGKTDYDFVNKELADFFRAHDRLAIEKGEPIRNEEQVTYADDGHHEILETIKTPIYRENGQLTGVLGIGRDITDRKISEETTRLNEARLLALLKLNQMTKAPLKDITDFALDEAVRLTGSKIGYLAFMNEDETVLTMYSWSKSAMKECRIEDKPIVYSIEKTGLWGEAVRQRKPVITNDYSQENIYKKGYPEGHVAIKSHVNIPIFDGDKIVAVAGVGNKEETYNDLDVQQVSLLIQGMWMIVKRQRDEASLHEAYNIINRSPAVTFLWKNAEGWPVEFVSDNVIKLFGYTAEEFISGKISYEKTIDPHDIERVMEEIRISSEEKKNDFTHKPYRIKTKNGMTKWLDDMTFIRRDEYGNITHFEGIVLDITERVKAEEEREKLRKKFQRSQKMESLGLLAGGVAHDLNNILSGIVSYPDLLLLDLPEDSSLRKPIQTIQESGNKAVDIVQDLLTIARGVASTKEPLNINDFVEEYLTSPEYNKLVQFNPTVKVNLNLDPDLLNINGSLIHIRKVIMNLVSNASEAIEESGNIYISTENRYIDTPLKRYEDVNIGEYVVLSVSDDGHGIPSDDLEKIFEPFFTKKIMGRSGTGLGLAVVWNILQDHDGYIDVLSTGNGTTFELYFPIIREAFVHKPLSIPIEDLKGDGEKVLIVDDIQTQREISCSILEALGYKPVPVSSGEEAVEYLKENTVDLVLLDMIMEPGMSGRETYEKIIKIHPKQKAIIVSGFAETDDVKNAQKIGAGQYIKKPLTWEKIGIAIKKELKN